MYEPYRPDSKSIIPGMAAGNMMGLAIKLGEVFGLAVKAKTYYTVPIQGGLGQ